MKKQILDRYSRTSDNEIIIDIFADKVADLYNNFDRNAPYVKKELDQDLVEYIIDSVGEIRKEDFVIQFRLKALTDANLSSRVKKSVQNYFLYLTELEYRERASMIRNSLVLLGIGILILCLSVIVNHKIADYGDILAHVFAEGLNVAAWVSLWNAIATFLINWPPHRKKTIMYERISKAKILFHEEAPSDQ